MVGISLSIFNVFPTTVVPRNMHIIAKLWQSVPIDSPARISSDSPMFFC